MRINLRHKLYVNSLYYIGLMFLSFFTLISQAETIAVDAYVPSGPDNATLTQRVLQTVAKQPTLSALSLELKAQNGVISIIGTIPTMKQAEAFVQLVASVNDVRDVNTDKLVVTESDSSRYDDLITARVEGVILQKKFFGDLEVKKWPIRVNTNGGIVYLRGVVNSQAQMLDIIRLIQSMRSVPRVISMLVIRQGPVYR